MRRWFFAAAGLALALACAPLPGSAQVTTSVLEGTISDRSGGVLPKAGVRITGGTVDQTTASDRNGFYRIAALPAGTYTVTASLRGFKTQVMQGIALSLDRTARLDITMEVAPRSESVTVTAAVPLIDSSSSAVKQVIDTRTIESIPLNGRNYIDLILLTPGVAVNTNARSDLTNRDTNGAIMGERAGNTAYLIDGLDNSDDFHGGVFQAFTQDAIQEFEVIDAGYKAEFGRGSAAIVNVVSKSGSNQVHGSGFLFARNDALDTSNLSGQGPPKLSRYDYGMTLGAPIRRDKAWFFTSLEAVQETRGNIFPPNVPASLTAGEDFSKKPETNDFRAFGKYTQRINENNNLVGTMSWTRDRLSNQLADPVALPSASTNSLANTWLGSVSLTTVVNPRVILDSAFSVRAQNFGQNQNEAIGQSYSIFFLDDGSTFDFGPPIGSIQTLNQRYYTAHEVVSFFVGRRHSVKAGLEYIRTTADGVNGQGLQDVIVTIHPFFDLYGVNSFQIPQGIAFLHPGDNLTRLRNNGTSLFIQDDWRVHPKLTLSGGIRYDYDSKFGATRNVAPRLGLAWSPDQKTVVRTSWGMFYDRYRLGIAQAVPELGGFNGTTVVELDYPRLANDALIPFPGSLGAFAAAQGNPNFLNDQFNIPTGSLVTASNVQNLTGMTADQFVTAVNNYLGTLGMPFTPVDFSPSTGFLRQDITGNFEDQIRVARPFHTPYDNMFTAGVERELSGNLAISATYIHRSIRDVLGVRITNLSPASATAGTPITTDGGPLRRSYGPWYDGKYDGLVLKITKRFSHRFQAQANYTFAASTDDLLNPNLGLGIGTQGGGAVPTNNNNIEFDRGNSDLFVPHAFVGSGVVELPLGFRVSGVLRATSGYYFTAAGTPTDYDGDGIVSSRPPGTKRNQFRGPASVNLDMRFEKMFRFAERYDVSVLAEFFNITNQANPKLINNFYLNGAPGPDFGHVLVPLSGREVQMGLRFQF
jgi:Carboxypeptidase regulatory-like domain/TonB dependent receptor-like, beta-barrel